MQIGSSGILGWKATSLVNRMALGAFVVGLLALTLGPASAEPKWPSKVVRIVVPAPAGGISDTVARLLAEQLSANLGQPFVVENIAGASGSIGAKAMLSAPADGYTMMVITSATLTEVPQFMKVSFDPLKDTLQVGDLVRAPLLLVAHPSVPVHTVRELIAYAKANAGKLSVASYGTGTRAHYAAVAFDKWAGVDLQHVPYRGSIPAVSDLLAGHVPLAFEALPNVIKHVQSGKLNAIAVLAPERVAVLPDTPTMKESGFAGLSLGGWQGAWVSSRTPPQLAETIHAEIARAFAAPKIREALANSGYAFSPVTTIQAQQEQMKAEFGRNAEIVHTLKIKGD